MATAMAGWREKLLRQWQRLSQKWLAPFFRRCFASVKLFSWCDGPQEWQPLTAWARALMKRWHELAAPAEPLECENS